MTPGELIRNFLRAILGPFLYQFCSGRVCLYATVKIRRPSTGILKGRKSMFTELISGTILDGNSGQDGLEYVALAAIILVVLVVVGNMIAKKLQEGGSAATRW
jgi:hypothetical protein